MNISPIGHEESKLVDDFQPAENEPIITNEVYPNFLIGEIPISIDHTSKGEKTIDESIYEHDTIPLTSQDECMTAAIETIKYDNYISPTVEDKSENCHMTALTP